MPDPPPSDLKAAALSLASSRKDPYEILSLKPSDIPTTSVDQAKNIIQRAWRRASLLYHPDKAGPDDEKAKEMFELVRVCRDVLSDVEARMAYDGAVEGERRRKEERDRMESGRREMVDRLERGEAEARAARAAGKVFGSSGMASGDRKEEDLKLKNVFLAGKKKREAKEKEKRDAEAREAQRVREAEAREVDKAKAESEKARSSLDAMEAELKARLKEVRDKKAARKKAKEGRGVVKKEARDASENTARDAREKVGQITDMLKKEQESLSREGDITTTKEKAQDKDNKPEPIPPLPASYNPDAKTSLNELSDVLQRLRQAQQDKTARGEAQGPKSQEYELTDFTFSDGRRIRLPRFRHGPTSEAQRKNARRKLEQYTRREAEIFAKSPKDKTVREPVAGTDRVEEIDVDTESQPMKEQKSSFQPKW